MMTSMQIHAHRLFDLIDASPNGLSVEELRQQATEQLGADTTYETCSKGGLSFDETIAFFHSAGKVVAVDGRMHLNRGQICNG